MGQIASAYYQTTSEVVREALRLFERQEREREQPLHQIKAKLECGEFLDGDKAYEELREMIERRATRALLLFILAVIPATDPNPLVHILNSSRSGKRG